MSNSVSNPGKFPGGITPENNASPKSFGKHEVTTLPYLENNRKAQS